MFVHQMDVITAYVQGDLTEELYMEQPEGFEVAGEEDKVCRLKRPLYGLKQAGREWYKKLSEALEKLNFKRTQEEPCVFVKEQNGIKIIVVIYVDDLLIGSNNWLMLMDTKKMLSTTFKMEDLGPVNDILGIHVTREGQVGSIKLDQRKYINNLITKFKMTDAKPVDAPLENDVKLTKEMTPTSVEEKREMENVPYRQLIGALVYLSNATRPDITYAANYLSRFCSNPGIMHWRAAKRVLRYLKGTQDLGINYTKSKNSLTCFVDADWAGDLDDRKSSTGYVLILAGGPISWETKKQQSVALSTMEAEYMALSEATKEVVYMRRLMEAMKFHKFISDTTTIYCDNQSAIHLSKNYVYHGRAKHIHARYHYTRGEQERRTIEVKYIPTENMMADVLTKGLGRVKHQKALHQLQMT